MTVPTLSVDSYAGGWTSTYPAAQLILAPGLASKRASGLKTSIVQDSCWLDREQSAYWLRDQPNDGEAHSLWRRMIFAARPGLPSSHLCLPVPPFRFSTQ
jgi:hypothetical protein